MKTQLLSSLVGTYYSTILSNTPNRYTNLYLVTQSILTLLNDSVTLKIISDRYIIDNISEFEHILILSGQSSKLIDGSGSNMSKVYYLNDSEYTILDILTSLNDYLFFLNKIIIETLSSLDEDIGFDISKYDVGKNEN